MKSLAMIPVAGLALLAAACGGSSGNHVARIGTTTSGSTSPFSSSAPAQSRAVAYSRCMRSSGVPGYPDPNSSGGTDKSKVTAARSEVGTSKFDAALNDCKHLLPPSTAAPSPAEVQQVMNGMTDFARCMRGHGVSNWPDPYLDVGRPTFDIHNIDYQAPRISRAIHECRHLMPGSTEPRMCSALLAQQNGDPAGDEQCFAGCDGAHSPTSGGART